MTRGTPEYISAGIAATLGDVSAINGEKARFHRIKKSRTVRRERNRVMRKKLGTSGPGATKGESL